MGQPHGFRPERHLSRVHLGKVKNVVHKLQQRRAACADGFESLVPLGLALDAELQQLGVSKNGVERGADVVADDAEEQAPRLFGRAGARKRILKLGRMLRRLFALNDCLAQFGAFALDDEYMDEATADETAERRKRRERPNDLEGDGRHHGETVQEHRQVSSTRGIPTVARLHERENRRQEVEGKQQAEGQVARGTG